MLNWLKKDIILKINIVVLLAIGVIDIIRGYMHTFRVRYAAENLAKIEPIPDSLVLMGSFGISNFLTGFIYFLVVWKAKHLVPYILFLIPISYFIGGVGFKVFQGVQLESEFRGQHMMSIYLPVCFITAIVFFISEMIKKRKGAFAISQPLN